MIAMAITQIHTHRRNRHGSWRDGEGGALDAPRPPDPGLDGGADAEAPAESSESDYQPTRSHPHRRATNRNVGGRQLGQRHPSQRAATPSIPPRLKIAHAHAASLACRTRWRLRRSTRIGGIATDHGATARAARSTPRAPDPEWMDAPTQRRQREQRMRRQVASEPSPPPGREPQRGRTATRTTPSIAAGRNAFDSASPEDSTCTRSFARMPH